VAVGGAHGDDESISKSSDASDYLMYELYVMPIEPSAVDVRDPVDVGYARLCEYAREQVAYDSADTVECEDLCGCEQGRRGESGKWEGDEHLGHRRWRNRLLSIDRNDR
jgi:hypothetical protein